MATHTFCDGVQRRDFLKVGAVSGFGLGMGLPQFLAKAKEGDLNPTAKGKAAIFVRLAGGPTHMDTFDLKPDAPDSHRGEFKEIKTNVPGVRFCEHLPKLAKVADKFAILRGVSHTLAAHALGTQYLMTGNRPLPSLRYPSYGAVVSKEMENPKELPAFVAVPSQGNYPTGYLGVEYGPFETGGDPGKAKKGFKVRDFSLPAGLSRERFDRRRGVRDVVDQRIRELEASPELLDTMDAFHARAYSLLTSTEAQKAFSFDGETDETFELYGSEVTGDIKGPDNRLHPKGLAERLIIARRLVEAGVRFVTLEYGSWDCHQDVKKACDDQMRPFDYAITGLVTDLDRRGLLDSTLVWVTTEFGRTPKVNKDSGRDHWARVYSMLLAGGGFKPGLIHGASDSTGGEPARDAVTLENLMATIYYQMGIDANKELVAFGTRPIEIVKDAKIARSLLG